MRAVALCWVVFLLGCNGNSKPVPAPPAPQEETPAVARTKDMEASFAAPVMFSIATFNMHFANRAWEDTLSVIQAADADLICLQESSPEMEQYLTKGLAGSHPHCFFSGPSGISVADQFAFFSRYPLASPRRIPRSAGLFDSWVVMVDRAGTRIQVASVHLQPAVFAENAGPFQAIQEMQAVNDTHRAELQAILAELDTSLPTFVVGDCNSLSTASGMAPLTEAGMKDAIAETHESPETQTTWEWPTPWGRGAMRIDHLWHNDAWHAEVAQVLPAKGSDHRLLVGQFQLDGQ